MEIFSEDGIRLLLRWTHFLAGITWIGLLYYFNFVQAPSVAQFEAGARTEVTRKLVPRALWWFRWSALVTWLAGLLLILMLGDEGGGGLADAFTRPFPQGIPLLTGMILGTIMLLNVWGVIWRNQKIVIASTERVAGGGKADPAATGAARRALLASRTNVVFSIPMLFFMATSSHLRLVDRLTAGAKWTYVLIALAVIGLVELNALKGATGATKKPLEKVNTTIVSGFVLFLVLYVALQVSEGV